MTEYFYFAIPRNATRESREGALTHIENEYGIKGTVQAVRAERAFRLYRIEHQS